MRKKALMISGALLLAIVFIVVLGYCGANDKATISAQEAAQTVLQQYEGEVLETSRSGALYIVKLQTANGLYEVEVKNDGSGIYGITALEQFTNGEGIGEGGGQESSPVPTTSAQPTASPSPDGSATPESSVLPDPGPGNNSGSDSGNNSGSKPTATPDKGEKPTSTPAPPPSRPALISEDRAIELALAQVAGTVEDVDLERKGDTRYYLVEIETEDGKEAQVQIQAASGKVMSITWGDDDDNDDDGDADDDDAGDDDNDDQ